MFKNFIKIFSSKLVLPSMFLTLCATLFFNPTKDIEIDSFNRFIGQAFINGIDSSKRVSNFYFLLFFLIPIIFVIIWGVTSLLTTKSLMKNTLCISFINTISTISFIPLILTYIKYYGTKDSTTLAFINIDILIPSALILLTILYLIISYKEIFKFNVYKWSLLASIPLLILSTSILFKLGIIIGKFDITILFVIIIICLFLTASFLQNIINFNNLKKSYLIVMVSPILTSLSFETINILNQYNIFVDSKFLTSIVINALCIVLFIVLCFTKKSKSEFKMEQWYYPIILVTLLLIQYYVPMQMEFSTDFFEWSNHGTGISEFFNYSKLPIIETFDAHMLKNQPFGFLYGLLNHDFYGAVFLPYGILNFVLFYTLTYFMLSKIFDRDISFLLCLLYPITYNVGLKIYYMAFVLILCAIRAYKKPTYFNYILYWISAAFMCLYSLDLGFAFTAASIVSWIVIFFVNRDSVEVKKLIVSCFYVVASCLFLFFALCFIRNVNPINRITEFLQLSLSNDIWSLSSIGDSSNIQYFICYFLIPVLSCILYFYILLRSIREKLFINKNIFITISILYFAFVFNFSRGLIRHSLAEGSISTILFTLPIFIALSISVLCKKYKFQSFCFSYFSIVIFFNILSGPIKVEDKPLIANSLTKHLTFMPYTDDGYTKKVNRVTLSNEMNEIVLPIKSTFDMLLKNDETYIDFSNQTLLYALTNREKPVYVNQSPGLLSSELSQQMFINEINNMDDKVVLALLPYGSMLADKSIDYINNSYRYYLVSEYISKNFKPLLCVNNFGVWCRNDKWEDMKSKISSNSFKYEIKPVDYTYGSYDAFHEYALAKLPNIWAKYDKISISSKETLTTLSKNVSVSFNNSHSVKINSSSIDKNSGNYIYLSATSSEKGIASLDLGDSTNKLCTFKFEVSPGENVEYLIRVSSDFLWYSSLINTITINSDTPLSNVNMSILKGDSLTN